LTINRGQNLVARVQLNRARNGAVTVTTTYGTEIRGPRTVTLSSQDGKTFQRTGARGPAGEQIVVAPDLRQSVQALATELRRRPPTCENDVEPDKPQPKPRAHRSALRSDAPGQFRRAAFNYYVPAAQNSPSCDGCLDRCGSEHYRDCIFNTDNLTDILFSTIEVAGPQAAVKVAVCAALYAACCANCYRSGQGCCPVSCGGLTDTCCGTGATCMLPQQRTCCPPGQRVCRGVCCENSVVACAPDGFCGCAQGQTPCGDNCCEAGQVCCGGTSCCPAEKCRTTGICSDVPEMAKCGGQTCGAFDNCCGGQCCFGTCINNQCCPLKQGCGNVCCTPGQTCVSPGNCLSPTLRCRSTGRPELRRVSCRTQNAAGASIEICCRRGAECCAGQCCPTGQECCFSNGREVGCCWGGGVN
jgi:hypothetical protein